LSPPALGPADLVIHGAAVVTVDPRDHVIENGAVAVRDGRIVAVGTDRELRDHLATAARVLDARGKAVLPGFVDAHAHAGHALTRALGRNGAEWMDTAGRIYARGADTEFWEIEAALSALERIRCGTTTACLLFGGGPDVMRTDDPAYADRHLGIVERSGLREVLALGPGRPPGPSVFVDRTIDPPTDRRVTFERQVEVAADVIGRWRERSAGRVRVAVSCPVFSEADLADAAVGPQAETIALRTRELARTKGVLLVQDGHRSGSIALAERRLGLGDGSCLFAHCIDLTEADVESLERTGAKVAHNPTALMSVQGRCPAPELMGRGVVVALGSDAPAPDRPFDMFRHMFMAMRLHARHFRDETVLPPTRALRMATIDGARALGLEHEIGSVETGKRADLILLDLAKPHLAALGSPVEGVVSFANGADVDTVFVDGRIILERGNILTLDVDAVLEAAGPVALRARMRANESRGS
jgi:5-methylthioadenosine/S-adenosylhomocysteine deaminase